MIAGVLGSSVGFSTSHLDAWFERLSEPHVADYCLQLELPPDGKTLVETLRTELTSVAEQVDRRLPDGRPPL